jgi:hypothetical protein
LAFLLAVHPDLGRVAGHFPGRAEIGPTGHGRHFSFDQARSVPVTLRLSTLRATMNPALSSNAAIPCVPGGSSCFFDGAVAIIR